MLLHIHNRLFLSRNFHFQKLQTLFLQSQKKPQRLSHLESACAPFLKSTQIQSLILSFFSFPFFLFFVFQRGQALFDFLKKSMNSFLLKSILFFFFFKKKCSFFFSFFLRNSFFSLFFTSTSTQSQLQSVTNILFIADISACKYLIVHLHTQLFFDIF